MTSLCTVKSGKKSRIVELALRGLSDADIANETGSHRGTIRSVLSRARARGVTVPYGTQRGALAHRPVERKSLSCPVCDSQGLRVIRVQHIAGTTRRTRSCKKCKYRFFTVEMWCDENGNPIPPGMDDE